MQKKKKFIFPKLKFYKNRAKYACIIFLSGVLDLKIVGQLHATELKGGSSHRTIDRYVCKSY